MAHLVRAAAGRAQEHRRERRLGTFAFQRQIRTGDDGYRPDPALIAGTSELRAVAVGRRGNSGGDLDLGVPFPALPQVARCFPTALPP